MSDEITKEPIDLAALWERVPRGGDSFFGWRASEKGGALSVADAVVAPVIDTKKVSTSVTISTDAVDHTREVIVPSGVSLLAYQDNPIVLFEHGRNSDFPLPVGLSEDEDKTLHVSIGPDRIEATCFWDQKEKSAMQIFAAVQRRALRGASITVVPTEAAIYTDNARRKCLVIEAGNMVEWSWTALPMNPEAVRKSFQNNKRLLDLYLDQQAEQGEAIDDVLRSGRLDGAAILEPIRKHLELYRPRASVRGKGTSFSDPEERPMTKKSLTAEELKKGGRDFVTKAFGELAEYDDPTQVLIRKSYDEYSAGPVQLMSDMPFGAELLSLLHGAYCAIYDEIGYRLKKNENEAVTTAVAADQASLKEMIAATEGLFAQEYPNLEPLVSNCGEEGEDVMTSKSLLFLNIESRSRNGLFGFGKRLELIAKMPGLPSQAASALTRTAADVGELIVKAKSFKPPEPAKPDPVVEQPTIDESKVSEQLGAITGALAKLTESLGKLTG